MDEGLCILGGYPQQLGPFPQGSNARFLVFPQAPCVLQTICPESPSQSFKVLIRFGARRLSGLRCNECRECKNTRALLRKHFEECVLKQSKKWRQPAATHPKHSHAPQPQTCQQRWRSRLNASYWLCVCFVLFSHCLAHMLHFVEHQMPHATRGRFGLVCVCEIPRCQNHLGPVGVR